MTLPTVVQVAEQLVRDAEFELKTGVLTGRCDCGCSALRITPTSFVCAGCGAPRVRPSQSTGSLSRGSSGAQGPPPPGPALGADNFAPLRLVVDREVRAASERLFLACGHAVERAHTRGGWAERVRCVECGGVL